MTRTLAQYIAGGYWVESGKPNHALEDARRLAYDPIEEKMLEAHASAPKVAENSNGSFERLMSAFGALEARGRML